MCIIIIYLFYQDLDIFLLKIGESKNCWRFVGKSVLIFWKPSIITLKAAFSLVHLKLAGKNRDIFFLDIFFYFLLHKKIWIFSWFFTRQKYPEKWKKLSKNYPEKNQEKYPKIKNNFRVFFLDFFRWTKLISSKSG